MEVLSRFWSDFFLNQSGRQCLEKILKVYTFDILIYSGKTAESYNAGTQCPNPDLIRIQFESWPVGCRWDRQFLCGNVVTHVLVISYPRQKLPAHVRKVQSWPGGYVSLITSITSRYKRKMKIYQSSLLTWTFAGKR